MKASAKKLLRSAPVIHYLSDPNIFTNNKLEEAMQCIGFSSLMNRTGFRKQKSDPLLQVMFALLIWPLLEVRSLSHFCGQLSESLYCRRNERLIRLSKTPGSQLAKVIN